MLYALLLVLHVLAAAAWVGGMACMHFAVRPAAVSALQPPQRVPFMMVVLSRFFTGVAASIGVLLVSGVSMIAYRGGFAAVHWSIHAMLAMGLLMIAVFGHVRFATYPRAQRAATAADWKAAAMQLDSIRRLVAFNLVLGTLTFAIALAGRTL
ncbi:CopD family protein [Schlegelella sp. S2-27]|uniref:CopD family protein n=1 Tax=Caldimonas mangrovi TaxID=2944811 RepID=A0ABT0YHE1_9BURK|nr:CopD family protein [Caldimonas mangrovi]MCM5678156.1 CopD family protein [Caldimonas mangrovi]